MMSTTPVAAIVIGSGLADAVRPFPVLRSTPYAEISGLPIPSVKGHGGTLDEVVIEGQPVAVFVGRSHLYEGISHDDLTAPIREMQRRGIHHLVLTNAVGGLHPLFEIGDVVLVQDVIDLTFRGPIGSVTPISNDRDVIHRGWRERIRTTSIDRGLPFREGVYMQVLGPSYETRSEIRMARRLGADVIGMSTAREAKIAASLGMSVCALSVVTNRLSDVSTPVLNHQHVVDAGMAAAPTLSKILSTTIFAL